MKLKLNNAKKFTDVVSALSELLNDATFLVKKDGITVNAADPTMVALVNMKIKPEFFDEYMVEADLELTLGLADLSLILRRAGTLPLVLDITEDKKLQLTINENRKFTQPVVDTEYTEPPEMNIDFVGVATVSQMDFAEAVDDASVVSDLIIFSTDNGTLKMDAESNLSDVYSIIPSAECSGTAKVKLSLEYVKKMLKSSAIASVLKLSIADDAPLKATIDGGTVVLTYIIAPRVDD